MDMWPEAVEPVANRLAGAGEDLTLAWPKARSAIDTAEVALGGLADHRDGAQVGGETAIGRDPLAAAFRAIYEADRDIVKAIADQAPGEVQVDGELGVECAHRYAGAEDFARAALARAIIEEA